MSDNLPPTFYIENTYLPNPWIHQPFECSCRFYQTRFIRSWIFRKGQFSDKVASISRSRSSTLVTFCIDNISKYVYYFLKEWIELYLLIICISSAFYRLVFREVFLYLCSASQKTLSIKITILFRRVVIIYVPVVGP